jgi:hypothetical protein
MEDRELKNLRKQSVYTRACIAGGFFTLRKKLLDYIVIRLEQRYHIRPRVLVLRVFFRG